MADFVRVARLDQIPELGKQLFEVDDRLVVLFRVEGQVYCLEDLCTHDGGPLGEGRLTGHAIACPRHGAQFDVRDGKALTMPATEDTLSHETKVEDGEVFVRLAEDQ